MDASEHKFLAMWDILGLETLIDITAREQENIMAALRDEKLPNSNPIQHMVLRARYNTQRHYEIYYFTSELTEQDIRYMFEHDPQVIVDAIRNVGHKLYSDRADKTKQVIF